MEKNTLQEKESEKGHNAFLMIKGDLTQKIITNKKPTPLGNGKIEEGVHRWLKDGLKEYANETSGEKIEVLDTKIIKGLTREELVKLYGTEHGKWLDSLTKRDFDKHLAIYNGEKGPLVLAIVRVDGSINNKEAEKRLIKVRDIFRKDWHNYLGKKEIKLEGGSTLWLSGMHVGNYDEAKFLLDKYSLST